jgi:hypothetical protein
MIKKQYIKQKHQHSALRSSNPIKANICVCVRVSFYHSWLNFRRYQYSQKHAIDGRYGDLWIRAPNISHVTQLSCITFHIQLHVKTCSGWVLLYRMIKTSPCTWWLQYNRQVHSDFFITLYNSRTVRSTATKIAILHSMINHLNRNIYFNVVFVKSIIYS